MNDQFDRFIENPSGSGRRCHSLNNVLQNELVLMESMGLQNTLGMTQYAKNSKHRLENAKTLRELSLVTKF